MNKFTEILKDSYLKKCEQYWINSGYDLSLCKRKYSRKYRFLGVINNQLNYYSITELFKIQGNYELINDSEIINKPYLRGCKPYYGYVGNVKLTLKNLDYFKLRQIVGKYKSTTIVNLDSHDMTTLVVYQYSCSIKKYNELNMKKEALIEIYGYFSWDKYLR